MRNKYLKALLAEKGQDTDEIWSSITTQEGSVQQFDFLDENEKLVFKTAYEMDQRWVIEHSADRAPFICQASSINLFLPANIHKRDLHMLHFMAWKKGVKSLYYCRSASLQRSEKVSSKVPEIQMELSLKAKQATTYEECPGVSVTSLAITALAGLLLLPVGSYAQSRVIVKRAYQLERAPEVKSLGQTYDALAGLYVLYDQCGDELGITDEKKAYVSTKFTQTAREYQIAYQDAYVSYVGASPSQALVDDIAASIKAQQQKTVNDMALSIRDRGCTSERFRKLLKYANKAEALDNAPPPEPTLQEPKLKFRKKSPTQ